MNSQLIDQEALQKFTLNDEEMLADLAILFSRNIPATFAKLEMSYENRDAKAIQETAHQVKSQLSYFFCESLVKLAQRLEDYGRSANLDDVGEVTGQLAHGVDSLLEELNGLTGLSLYREKS